MDRSIEVEFKSVFAQTIKKHKAEVQKFIEKHGSDVIGEVTVAHLFRGIRGIPISYTPVSHVDAQLGVLYRSTPLLEVSKLLPKFKGSDIVSAEAVWWFLMTGEKPTLNQTETLRKDLHMHSNVPVHVFRAIDGLPLDTRPMTRLCTGIITWTTTSVFQNYYDKGLLKKEDYWKHAFDDALRLVGGIGQIAAYIYRVYCKKENPIEPNQQLDWVGNFAYMMGFESKEAHDLLRLFVFSHMDHSASNVSAHTAHTVGSALANVFYTATASMLGLSGPLHGHANEQTVVWLLKMIDVARKQGYSEPDIDFIKGFIKDTLKAGQVIPGYGHAALRVEDPRFTLFFNLCTKRGFNTPLLRAVKNIYSITPDILSKIPKIANPYPNMDAITGSCLHSIGLVEHDFYTVLFGVSRLIGLATQHIIDRSIGQPIFRPKTMSLHTLRATYNTKKNKKTKTKK